MRNAAKCSRLTATYEDAKSLARRLYLEQAQIAQSTETALTRKKLGFKSRYLHSPEI